MKYALDRLEEIITCELKPLSEEMNGLPPDHTSTLLARIKSETSGVRKFLWASLQEINNKEQLRLIALQYKSSIDYLVDEVEAYILSNGHKNQELKGLYEQVELCLRETLLYIQRHFSIWVIPAIDNNGHYLHTSLNEQEITIILCALVDSGVISNHTYTSFLEMVAPILATRHKKGLTATSMLKSKDKLTADMKKKIKDLFLGMAREVDNY